MARDEVEQILHEYVHGDANGWEGMRKIVQRIDDRSLKLHEAFKIHERADSERFDSVHEHLSELKRADREHQRRIRDVQESIPDEITGVHDLSAVQDAGRAWRDRAEAAEKEAAAIRAALVAAAEKRAAEAVELAAKADGRYHGVAKRAIQIVLALAIAAAGVGGTIYATMSHKETPAPR